LHVSPSGSYNVKVGADFNSAAAVLPDAADGTDPQPMDVVEGASDEVVHADDDQDDEPLVNEEQIRLKEMYEAIWRVTTTMMMMMMMMTLLLLLRLH